MTSDGAVTQPADVAGLVELNECPPGLFLFKGHLGFKSEYATTLENPRRYQCDAYVVESGEYFHGGAANTSARGALLVQPLDAAALLAHHEAQERRIAEANAAMTDALAGWRYIRKTHGELYGVGWDRVETALTRALLNPIKDNCDA